MRSLIIVLLAAFMLGCGPVWMIPGSGLSGEVSPHPGDWSFSNDAKIVQLETNSNDPYSVNIWGVGTGKDFYVAAGDKTSTWAQNMTNDPNVRLKVEDALFELRAVSITDEAEMQSVLAALSAKYDFEPDPEQREKAMLFRLDAR